MKMFDDIVKIITDQELDGSNSQYLDFVNNVSSKKVLQELQKPCIYSLERLMTLISPAAADYLELMAQKSQELTIQRFGKTIGLYAPLYVSNVCINSCRYCGFNCHTKTNRTRLTIEQALSDSDIIAAEGFRNILLVSGEDTNYITTDYLCCLSEKLAKQFAAISMEVYPMTAEQYNQCFKAGIDGVTLYQETYNRQAYQYYHPAGPKSDYDYRLASHSRAAKGGMRRLGLGFLIGLCDWTSEVLAMAEHANYLIKHYWQSQVNFSFPRLRPAENTGENYRHLVSDKELVQMMCALRLCFADSGIYLSTRETAEFRDNVLGICVTQMSAGSKTNPGGYSTEQGSLEQFEIADDRTPKEIAKVIIAKGKEPVWKDWDYAFCK